MPYGLPGAIKLRDNVLAFSLDGLKQVVLMEGTLLQPLYPGADQDGWNGEWRVKVAKTGEEWMLAKEELEKHL